MVASIVDKKEIISVKEARKILGKYSLNLTNSELRALLTDSETVVKMIMSKHISSKNDKIKS